MWDRWDSYHYRSYPLVVVERYKDLRDYIYSRHHREDCVRLVHKHFLLGNSKYGREMFVYWEDDRIERKGSLKKAARVFFHGHPVLEEKWRH